MIVEVEQRRRAAITGMLAGLAALTMLFAALVSAYVVRRGISDDWTRLYIPNVLYFSLLSGAAVSALVGMARKTGNGKTAGQLLSAAMMAALFCTIHLYSWRELAYSPGAATDFLLVISALLVLCAAFGIPGLIAAGLKGRRPATMGYYWLYLNALWAFLLVFFHVLR